ncbi:MAG: PDZ domain-containing protein [Acidobacteria bacterium]|nr:PDZ domain-containing protein [Acidobacteriota bacterium]
MNTPMLLLLVSIGACEPAFGQLTREQKEADFRFLAGLYSKNYAPLDWKKTLFGFDALAIGPWIERVRTTRDDLEFYDLSVDYVASLRDTHDAFSLPSDFLASLGIGVDLYDGRVLIDSINRTRLPAARFPFDIGDEVVSVDGVPVEELIRQFSKYAVQGNDRSTRRRAAARIATRPQSRMPYAPRLANTAEVVVRRPGAAEESYTIPWLKTGFPMEVGPVPFPKTKAATREAFEEDAPEYLRAWRQLQYSASVEPYAELGTGARTPIYTPPANFVQRLGRTAADFFFSGTYEARGKRIGLIRIPSYGTLATAVLRQFESEIEFFEQNTDGLVVDEIRNPGGFLCFGENIALRLTPYPFDPVRYELRVSQARVNSFYNALNSARIAEAEPWIQELWENLFREVSRAYGEKRGLTAPVPLCSFRNQRDPYAEGVAAYTKPLIMLVDEFSTSTADSVPAMIQDAGRGLIFGMRSNGAGGTNTSFLAGAFSEGFAGMTLGLMVRPKMIVTSDYPTTRYIENVGVRPDIEYDYMTRENLLQRGQLYVEAFTEAILRHIEASR